MAFICIQAQIAIAGGEIFQQSKPVTTEGCTYTFENLVNKTPTSNLRE